MKKPKKLIDFNEHWETGKRGGIVDLYKKIPYELIEEYNNLVEVVNMILEEIAPFGQDKLDD